MKYKLTKAEQETVINFDNELDTASVYTHDSRLIKKLRELRKQYPKQFVLECREHGSVTYTIPKRCVGIRPPYSEKRREQQRQEAKENGLPFMEKLRTHKKKASGIAISIRNNELYTKEWQCRISIPTQRPTYLAKTAFALFAKNYQWEHPIRSVTVRAINLFEEDCPIQYDLFTDVKSLDRQERLDAAIEQIRFRLGKDAIKNGVLFQKSKMPTERKVDLVMPPGMIG